jgi:hypothetical protein
MRNGSTPAGALVAAPTRPASLSPAWRHALAVFLTVRLVASLTALAGYGSIPAEKISPTGGYSKPAYSKAVEIAFGHWERWDALWFIHVARDGYRPESQSAAIMPVYPLLIRGLHGLTGLPWLICGLVISNAAFLVALYVLYRLAELELGEQMARRASWYLALFPGSLFFLAPYTESLYLLLAVCAFFAARRSRWLLAGVSAAVAGATRNVGAFLVVPLSVEFAMQYRAAPPEARIALRRRALWLLLCPVGTLSYLVYWHLRAGDALRFVHAQEHWQRHFEWPWVTYWNGMTQAYEYATVYPGGVYVMEALAVTGAVLASALAFRKLRPAYGIFAWLNLLPPLFAPFDGRALLCCARYMSIVFPAFLALAAHVKTDSADRLVLLCFTALYGLSVALFVTSQWMY